MGTIASDFRYALRMLRKGGITTAAAVLTLALGIGGTTAMFSVVNAILLRPLPYAKPDRLVAVFATSHAGQRGSLSPGDFMDFRRDARSFEGLTAILESPMSLTGGGHPEQVRVQSVSGNFFTLLGINALAGRTFLPEDDREGSPDRVVLSEQLWRRRYSATHDLSRVPLTLGGRPAEVVGVVAGGFRFDQPADLWVLGNRGIPRAESVPGNLAGNRDVHILRVVGRLAPGVPIAAAQAELDGEAARLARLFPQTNDGYGVALEPLQEALVGDTRTLVLVLLGAVGALLAIAVVNVANLMLVRTNDRVVELRMRHALGATRSQLVRLLLAEAIALATLGGLLGTAAATWCVRALVSIAPANLPRLDEAGVDMRVLACALLLTMVTACAFGAWPAWRGSRVDIAPALAGAGRTSGAAGRRRTQYLLAGGELALAQILVAAAALLAVSFWRLTAVDPGVQVRDRLTVDVSLPPETYGANPSRKAAFHEMALQRINEQPGITGAAMSLTRPLSGAINRGVWIEGHPAAPRDRQTMSFVPVSETFFDVVGMPLRRGRGFTFLDSATGERVVIVNEAFVRRYFGSLDPLVQRIGFGNRSDPNYWRRVVGVVADAREQPALPAPPTAYIPFRQDNERWNFASYVVRSSLPPSSVGRIVQRAILAVDADQPISPVRTLEESLSRALAVQRFTALLASLFGALALVLAAVGTFGVTSHAVASRRRELGVRLALGARNTDILGLVAAESVRTIGPALLVGFGLAFVAGRAISSLLYQVRPSDPRTLAIAGAVLVMTASMAVYVPVRRALAADPVASLRDE